MTAKLTLSVEKEIIKKAKKYSLQTGKSLSKIVESYLESVVSDTGKNNATLSPRIKKLNGAIKLPPDFDNKKEVEKLVNQKFK